MRTVVLDSKQSITDEERFKLSYYLDAAMLYKLAELVVGGPINPSILEKQTLFFSENHFSWSDALEPFTYFLECTGLGGSEDDENGSQQIFTFHIYSYSELYQLAAKIDDFSLLEELSAKYEDIFQNSFSHLYTQVGFSLQNGKLHIILGEIDIFSWYLLAEKIIEFEDECRQLKLTLLK